MLFGKLCNRLLKTNILQFPTRIHLHTTFGLNKKRKIRQECRKKKMTLNGKNALVLGGNSGIGYETADALLCAGCKHVIVAGRNLHKCCEAAKKLNQCYGKNKASCVNFDVRDAKEYEEAFMHTLDKHCQLDILVNCVGILNGHEWEDEICTNVISLIRGTLLGYDFMGTDSVGCGGVIINIAGTMGLEPMSGAATFAASKHAVVGFSRSYGNSTVEADTGIRLVTLCPGITCTDTIKELEEKAMIKCESELEKNVEFAKKQNPDSCGKSVVHLVKYGDTGSVWVIEGDKLYKLNLPDWKCYSELAKNFL